MADAALKLQPACDTGLRCEAALACYEISQAQLQGVSSAANRAHDDAPFETHQVRAMMNALAPVFGFDAVADPFIVPLSPREQAEVERLQTRAGLADIASLMLATLADRYLDTLAALADLARLSIGGDFPPLAFLNLADGLLRQLPAQERAAAVPQLDHALMRLKTDDPRAAMALDTLWAHVRADAARCAGAERMLMDKAPVEGGCGRLPGGRGRARVDQGRHVLAADPGETPALERCVERRSALSTGRRGGER